MSKIQIAAISRAGIYSPNHIGNDAAILNATVEQLRRRGCDVRMYNEEQFLTTTLHEDVILNMCRLAASLEKLQRLEEEGRLIINSGFGIENCTREKMTRLLMANGVPYPDSLMVDTNTNVRPLLEEAGIDRCWIKRGENHAMHKEDVHYCRHAQEAQEILHEFFYRGIRRAVINRHLDGDLVKFYGLADGSFFYWFYPLEQGHSKFSDERINGMPEHLKFDEAELRKACEKGAAITGIVVYGGDCIIDHEGNFQIIDFNDWPSFAPCRAEAAPYIAKTILSAIKEWQYARAGELSGLPAYPRHRRTRKGGAQ